MGNRRGGPCGSPVDRAVICHFLEPCLHLFARGPSSFVRPLLDLDAVHCDLGPVSERHRAPLCVQNP